MKTLAPNRPRGLVTGAFNSSDWPHLSAETRCRLREIPDYQSTSSQFISHNAGDLHRPRVAELKQDGAAILCWTIRSVEAEQEARGLADNITFEGYQAKPLA